MADNFLSQDEVDALLKGVNNEPEEVKVEIAPDAVRPYNLATQERIVRGRMPTLEIIHERFARNLRIGLYNFFHKTAEISVGPIKVVKYSEFIRNLMVPTNLNLVQMKPLRGTALIVIEPGLVFNFVDTLFGGNGLFQTRIEGRDFTQTEMRIVQRVLEIVFDNYAKSWEPVYPITFEYIRSEMNTQFANIATPNEVVVTTTFNIDLGTTVGSMHFCIPYSMIEPVRDLMASSMQGETLEADSRWIKVLTQQIQTAEVEIKANIGTCDVTLQDIANMKVGDIFPLFIPERIEAKIDGVPIMECTHGVRNGNYALKIEKMLTNSTLEKN